MATDETQEELRSNASRRSGVKNKNVLTLSAFGNGSGIDLSKTAEHNNGSNVTELNPSVWNALLKHEIETEIAIPDHDYR